MPYVGWWDVGRAAIRSFGTEGAWTDCPVGPEMLEEIAGRVTGDDVHKWGRLTTTALLSTPRKWLIERFMDVALDPESMMSVIIGGIVHEKLQKRLNEMGYDDAHVEGEVFGVKISGASDGAMQEPRDGVHIVEMKVTSAGSMKFIYEDGRAKQDHVVQTNINRKLVADKWGVDAASLNAEIRYYCMPEKQNIKGMGWIRVPGAMRFPVPYMDVEACGDHYAGWSPKKGVDIPFPLTVRENAQTLSKALGMIEAGTRPEVVINAIECMCDRVYSGSGKDYCNGKTVCERLGG